MFEDVRANTVSAATEEQTAAINEITRNVQTVSQSARFLQDSSGSSTWATPTRAPGRTYVESDAGTETTVADGGEPADSDTSN